MVLRSLSQDKPLNGAQPQPASKVFLETQKHIKAPYAIILQAEHSQLAGDLSAALSDNIFGELDPQVIQGTAEHDVGWDVSDKAQLEALGQQNPHPFPEIAVSENLDAWRKSIAHAASIAPLVEVIVSRHLTTLGMGDPQRQEFVQAETERRGNIERILPYEPADLDRWTGAIGFCDLLSLYLCSGSQQPVEFPFAHPADPASSDAPKTTLSWQDGSPRFSSPVLKPGSRFSLVVREYSGIGTDLEPLKLEWIFPQG